MLALALVVAAAPADRAAEWLAKFPTEQLKFDAAVGTGELARLRPSPASKLAYERARGVADKDTDHPQRRFWLTDYSVAKSAVTKWQPTDPKVNLNRPIDEALWCDVHGLRPETVTYASGPMRDGGGYRSTHALWALIIARDRKCLEPKAFEKATADVRVELKKAQPVDIGPASLDVDLYAERLLFLLLAGERDTTLS
ncbi:MAG: hypothetical protein JNK82_20050, partial [Myxococcaceae bacterium]|nr:hypothetical protein [Myxococcaceae bacterium]